MHYQSKWVGGFKSNGSGDWWILRAFAFTFNSECYNCILMLIPMWCCVNAVVASIAFNAACHWIKKKNKKPKCDVAAVYFFLKKYI